MFNGRANADLTDLAHSRGLAYGDGLFETLAVVAGKPLWLEAHLDRLREGLGRLNLQLNESVLLKELELLLDKAGKPQSGVIKVIICRCSGGRGYSPASQQSDRLLSFFPATKPAPYWHDGVKITLCQQRLSRQPALAGIKHLNRLEQVLASAELQARGFAEGLMQDDSGLLIEGTRSNLFLVRQGQLLTPALSRCGVAGIMRGKILEYAAQSQLPARVADLTLADVYLAEELFLCNSVFGIWPITAVDCHQKSIGPLSRHLQEQFKATFDV
ncbi:aminodeoxychorismate lyase [Spongiibacter sp. KMU-158]|uniref:Aminodeoxychorismate lyase n=1 Tax=Spongiibacter pelagi TaxID=2760804 RepID=A0A927GWP0_9GAMM|nr:aminodeoxychorismate lyase [Spongiibacter pelagi]